MNRLPEGHNFDLSLLLPTGKSAQKLVKPALIINPLFGPGPDAELFPVVKVDGKFSPAEGHLVQVLGQALYRPEGDGVAQGLVNGKDGKPLALGLGVVVAVEGLFLKARDDEVPVIHHHVLDAQGGQVLHQGLVPDPFGEPKALRDLTEVALEVVLVAQDLFLAVLPRDYRKYGLEKSPADRLNLPPGDELA